MANSQLIYGGVAGGGTSGLSVAWFGIGGLAGPTAVAYTAEVQAITISGTPTGGSYTLSYNGVPSGSLAYNAASSTVQTALNAAWSAQLPLGTSLTVAGSAGGPYTVTFPASAGNVSQIAVLSQAFTGGTTPSVATSTTTPGAGANPATAVIPAGFNDAGEIDASGLDVKYAETQKDVNPWGGASVARTLISAGKQTIDMTFLETNHTAIEVFHRLPLGATGVAGPDGLISGVTDGPNRSTTYSLIVDTVDGTNHLRAYMPYVQNTTRGNFTMPFGDAFKRPITLTAYPDSTGNAIYWYPVMTALAGV